MRNSWGATAVSPFSLARSTRRARRPPTRMGGNRREGLAPATLHDCGHAEEDRARWRSWAGWRRQGALARRPRRRLERSCSRLGVTPRARRPEDSGSRPHGARTAEQELARLLSTEPLASRSSRTTPPTSTGSIIPLLTTEGRVHVDLKEKLQRYSAGCAEECGTSTPQDMFIVDETVYRRIVWQGGGGYLVIHDHPEERWGNIRAVGADARPPGPLPAVGARAGTELPQGQAPARPKGGRPADRRVLGRRPPEGDRALQGGP